MLTTYGLPILVWIDEKVHAFSLYLWEWRTLLEGDE